VGDLVDNERKARHVRVGQRIRWAGQWCQVVSVTPVLSPQPNHRGGGYWFIVQPPADGVRRVHYYGNEHVEVQP
jgi:hypothetical protein